MEAFDIEGLSGIAAVRELVDRLDEPLRRRALNLLERIRSLRDTEICATAALDAAQLELDACSRQAWLSSLQHDDRDLRRIRQCEQIRSDVERLERRLVFTRAALHDQREELASLLPKPDTARRSA